MTGVKSLVFLMSLMWAAVRSQQSDVTVSSGFMSDQILPCTFLRSDYLTVHWYKGRKDIGVHSYYDGKDQLAFQDPKFKGRTSLSHDQLTRGNASLLLKKVQVSDGGSYGCYTSNKVNNNIEPQKSFINLEVFAPVAEISIVQEGCHVTCRSVGIYPEPRVTWSRNKMADTRIEKTEQQLYNISSSVRVDGDGDYSCNVSSVRSSWRATLTTASSVLSRTDDTLDCPALKSPLTSVTWRFNDKIIVQREDHLNITESWRDHVKDLSSSGSLTLQNLSPDLTGIFTCEVTNQEETHVKIINVTIADVTVASRFMRDQILPCTFPTGDDPLIHWYKDGQEIKVHSYYNETEQFEDQADQFQNRTSLFHDQLTKGNASLLLKKVQVSDGGRYKCHTRNTVNNNIEPQESFINLEVFAPVTEVSIVQEGENITCRSEGIYPEPQVAWSGNKMADTRIERTEQQLYNIRSSVRVDDEGDYSCNVSSLKSIRRATLTTAKTSRRQNLWLIPVSIILLVVLTVSAKMLYIHQKKNGIKWCNLS